MLLADQFRQILNSDPEEERVQEFLAAHPSILERWCGVSGINTKVLPKVSLHSHVTDFAIGDWRQTTNRWEWTLVEIERPRHKLFNQHGDPTKELTHALRQITDWRAWVQNNLHFARTILPDLIPLCDVAVIIGRRETVKTSDRNRLEMLQIQSPGLRIATFDSVLDVCAGSLE